MATEVGGGIEVIRAPLSTQSVGETKSSDRSPDYARGRAEFYRAHPVQVVGTDEFKAQTKENYEIASFHGDVVVLDHHKGLKDFVPLVDESKFVVGKRDFSAVAPTFGTHELAEQHAYVAQGSALPTMGKDRAEEIAHGMAIREQWRHAFAIGKDKDLLEFLEAKVHEEKGSLGTKEYQEYKKGYELVKEQLERRPKQLDEWKKIFTPEETGVELPKKTEPEPLTPQEIAAIELGKSLLDKGNGTLNVDEAQKWAATANELVEKGVDLKLRPEQLSPDELSWIGSEKPGGKELTPENKQFLLDYWRKYLGEELLKHYKETGGKIDGEVLNELLAKTKDALKNAEIIPIEGGAIPMAAPLLGNPAVTGDTKALSLISGYNARLDPSTESMTDLVKLQGDVLNFATPGAAAVILPAIDAVFNNAAEVQRLSRNERAKLAFTPEFPQNPEQLISLVREQLYRFELQTGSADMPGSWEKRIHFRNDPYGQNGRSLLEYFDDPSSPLAAITGRAWHYSSEGEMKHTTVGEMLKNEIRARERLKIRWELWNQCRSGMGGWAKIESILGPSKEAALSQHIEPLASMLPNDANPAGRLLGDGVSLAFDAYRQLARDLTFDGRPIVNIFSRNHGAVDGQPWNDSEVKALRERVRIYAGGDPQAELLGYRLAQVWGEAAWGDHFPKQEAQGGAGNRNSDHTSRLMRFFERIHRKKMGADASRDQMPPALLLPFLQETRLKVSGLPEMTMAEALNRAPGRLLRHLPWNKLADPVSDETWANSIEAAAKIFAIATSKELAFKGQDDLIKALINVSDCVTLELTAGALAEVVDLGLAGFRMIPLQETLKKATENVSKPPTDPVTGALNPAFQPMQRKPLSWWLARPERKAALEKTQKEWQVHFRYWILKGQIKQSKNKGLDSASISKICDMAVAAGFITWDKKAGIMF